LPAVSLPRPEQLSISTYWSSFSDDFGCFGAQDAHNESNLDHGLTDGDSARKTHSIIEDRGSTTQLTSSTSTDAHGRCMLGPRSTTECAIDSRPLMRSCVRSGSAFHVARQLRSCRSAASISAAPLLVAEAALESAAKATAAMLAQFSAQEGSSQEPEAQPEESCVTSLQGPANSLALVSVEAAKSVALLPVVTSRSNGDEHNYDNGASQASAETTQRISTKKFETRPGTVQRRLG